MHLFTNIAVFRTIRFIKTSYENAFKVGREFCFIFYVIYSEFKRNALYALEDAWETVSKMPGFEDTIMSNILNKRIDMGRFFSKCNIKILQLKPKLLSSFFRGYYINELNLLSTNISEDLDSKFLVIYDSHYHYLLFLNGYMSGKGVDIFLNDEADNYSINEESDALCYKLVFQKKNMDFIDPIKNLLNFFYEAVENRYDCVGEDDKLLFEKYLSYVSMY